MKVRIVGSGTVHLGATRYKIEWLTIKSEVNTQDGIDPDSDTDNHTEYPPKKDSAIQRAQEIFTTTNNLCWKVVTVTTQVVVWLSEEKLLAMWKDTDEETAILTDDDYAHYLSPKKKCELWTEQLPFPFIGAIRPDRFWWTRRGGSW